MAQKLPESFEPEMPASFQAEEKQGTNETGIGGAFSTIENNIGEFFNKHPTAKKYLSYLLDTTQDTQKKLDEQGKGGKVIGDEYLEIPHVREAFKEMSSKISPENKEGSALQGFASGALEAIGGLAATGYDPRNVSRFHALEGFGSGKIPVKSGEVVDEVLPLLKREQKLLGTGGPRFIAGEAGIAENRPYTMDISPVNPSMMGDELTGTVLPRELEGLSTISPEMAANQGLSLGRLNPIPPEYSNAMREEYLQSLQGKPIQVEPPERIATESELGEKLAPLTEQMSEGGPEFQQLNEIDDAQFIRDPNNLFKDSEGKGLSKDKTFENQWQEAVKEAEVLGINYKEYNNLDELQWDVTKKAAQQTIETGVNPLAKTETSEMRFPGSGLIDKLIEKQVPEIKDFRLRREAYQKAFDELVPAQDNNFVVLDSGNKYNPDELARIHNSPALKGIAGEMDSVLQELGSLFKDEALGVTGKYGFIADSELGGANIPNPSKKEFAVLMNPFNAIEMTNTPSEAAQRMVHIMLHEFTHNLARNEGGSYTWQLSKVYSKYNLERQLDAKQSILKQLTGGQEHYAPEFQELLQQYSESRGRPEISPDILTGTREGAYIRRQGPERTSGSNQSDGTGVVGKLITAIKKSRGLREEQENLYSEERGKRFAKAEKVKASGFKGHFQRLGKLKGELPKVEPEPISMNEKDTNELINMIMSNPNLQMGEKIRASDGLGRILGVTEGIPQRSQLKLLSQVFGPEIEQIVEMHAGIPITRAAVNEVFNFTKAQMSSGDMSFPFRQGLPLWYRKEWWQSWAPMINQMRSKVVFEGAQAAVTSDPEYGLLEKAGVRFADVGNRLEKGEEIFKSNIAAKLPWIRISEQGYVAFANNLRLWTAKNLLKEARKAGKKTFNLRGDQQEAYPTDLTRDIAKFINNHTGVGSLDFRTEGMKVSQRLKGEAEVGNFEKIAPELNYVFWSPRLQSSKIRRYSAVLNPKFWTKLDPMIRKESLKSLFAVAGFIGIVDVVSNIFGGESTSDPTSSDFGKAKFDNTRLDPGSGDLQYHVLASRLLAQARRQMAGEKVNFGESMVDIGGRFARSKESPLISFAHDWLAQKDFLGRPFNLNRELREMALPMILNTTIEVWQEDPELAPLIPFAIGGMGVQVQEPREEERLRPISEGSSEKLQEIQP